MKKIILFTITLFFFQIQPSFAYFDPGLGSIILQGIVAGIAATSLTIKIYWQKIKSFFKKKKKEKEIK